jgi:sortase family protein
MGYSGHRGPMPAVPRPPEEQALPEERRPLEKWWLAEKPGSAEQRGSAENRESTEKRESTETQGRSAETQRGSAETQRGSDQTQRGLGEKWWQAERQGPAEQRRSAEAQSLDEKWWLATKQGPAGKPGRPQKLGLPEAQGLAGRPGLAERRDSAETQPLPVIRGPFDKRGMAGAQGAAGTQEPGGSKETAGTQEPGGSKETAGTPGLPEDWWDPRWQAVQSPGAGPLQREILGAASGPGTYLASEIPDEAPPSWHQVLGNTFSLWAGRHLRWLRGAPGQGRGRLAAAAALAAGLVVVGIGAGGLITANVSAAPAVKVARPAPIAAPTEQAAAPPTTAVSAAPVGKARAVAKPVWVSIPAIGIKKTTLIHLGLNKNGTLQVPHTTTVAGWFTGGPRPGAVGSAVIAGHVDSKTGPGIFFWLRALKPGDKVYVGRADGTMAIFTVTREHMYAKDRFPTKAVYGAVPDAELRLITCGGIFDRSTGSYLSNVVVFARLSH